MSLLLRKALQVGETVRYSSMASIFVTCRLEIVNMEPYGTSMMSTAESRRTAPDRDGRRDVILKIAYAAFLQGGYAATSMSSIAAKVGGSKATLYNHFSSKEELFAAVIVEKCRDVLASVFDIRFEIEGFREVLQDLGQRFVVELLQDDSIAIYRLITAESGRFPEIGRAFYMSGPQKGIEILGAYFGRLAVAGKLKPGNTSAMASHFFELCKAELHHRKLWNAMPDPSDAEVAAAVGRGIAMFIAAYERPGA